jgi:hypothetical protein
MAEKTNFWSSTTIDPKRTFRWVLVFDHIPTYVVTKVGKPSFTVKAVEHNYIAHTFKYPGRVTWADVKVTLVDPVYPDASAKIIKILQASGYAIPGTEIDASTSLTKKDSNLAVGVPTIAQLDGAGQEIERWTLHNAWLSAATFGELSYETEEMINIELTFAYDWAEYEGDGTAENREPRAIMTGQGTPQLERIQKYREEMGAIKGQA